MWDSFVCYIININNFFFLCVICILEISELRKDLLEAQKAAKEYTDLQNSYNSEFEKKQAEISSLQQELKLRESVSEQTEKGVFSPSNLFFFHKIYLIFMSIYAELFRVACFIFILISVRIGECFCLICYTFFILINC